MFDRSLNMLRRFVDLQSEQIANNRTYSDLEVCERLNISFDTLETLCELVFDTLENLEETLATSFDMIEETY